MKASTLLVLSALTVAIAGAALYSRNAREQQVTASDSRAGQLLFPALRERINDVSAVAVTSSEGSFEVQRSGQGETASWGASDKGGYPVDLEKVRALVVGIANLTILEAKTADPERLPRLGLQDPTAPAARSKRVVLKDSKGEALADVIFGGELDTPRASGKPSQYVRRANENQSWEVAGRLLVDERLANWLDKQIVKLERTRVREVEMVHPDGERLVVERPSADVQDFQVRDLPAEAKLSWPGVAGSVASALEYLNLEDVRPASEVDLTGVEPTRAHFRSFDGLVVSAQLYAKDDKHYLAISAAFDPAARVEPPAPAEPAAPAEPVEGEAATPPPTPPAPPALKAVAEVEQEAASIRERTAPWVYVIPGWAAANLQKRVGDMLAKPGEGEEGAPDAGGAQGLEGLDLEKLMREAQGAQQGGDTQGQQPPEPPVEAPPPPAPTPEKPQEPVQQPPPGGGR